MSTACGRPQWGVRPMWTHVDRGEGVMNLIPFLNVINGWPLIPYTLRFPPAPVQFPPILQVPFIFRCSYVLTLNFLLPTKMLHILPPNMTKPFVSPLNDKFPL